MGPDEADTLPSRSCRDLDRDLRAQGVSVRVGFPLRTRDGAEPSACPHGALRICTKGTDSGCAGRDRELATRGRYALDLGDAGLRLWTLGPTSTGPLPPLCFWP